MDKDDIVDANGQLLNQQPAYDLLLNSEIQLQQREEYVTGVVAQRTWT